MFRLASLLVFLLLSTTIAGCGKASGTVKGKVSYNSKSLAMGTVTLIASDSIPYQSLITEDGTYEIKGIPPGDAKVLVISVHPSGSDPRAPKRDDGGPDLRPKLEVSPEVLKKWFPIPEKYNDPVTTTLKFTVNNGDNNYDIDLQK